MGTDPCLGTKGPDGLLSFTLLPSLLSRLGTDPVVEGLRE